MAFCQHNRTEKKHVKTGIKHTKQQSEVKNLEEFFIPLKFVFFSKIPFLKYAKIRIKCFIIKKIFLDQYSVQIEYVLHHSRIFGEGTRKNGVFSHLYFCELINYFGGFPCYYQQNCRKPTLRSIRLQTFYQLFQYFFYCQLLCGKHQ